MLVLFETSAGYAIFKISDEKKLKSVEDIATMFQTPEKAQKL
jgi:nucleolar protein 58